jgi:hypothetical protein
MPESKVQSNLPVAASSLMTFCDGVQAYMRGHDDWSGFVAAGCGLAGVEGPGDLEALHVGGADLIQRREVLAEGSAVGLPVGASPDLGSCNGRQGGLKD